MASEKILRVQQVGLAVSGVTRRRGRIGLTISWENIPWWGLIILLVGVIAGYSALTSTRYRDALSFMLDLPWNKEMLGKVEVEESGEWSFKVEPALKPGNYTLYAEFRDENQAVVGRSDMYRIKVPAGAPKLEAEPVTSPAETPILVQTSTPTIVGTATPGVTAVLVDDFSHSPLRIARRIWGANGVLLAIRVTFIAFAGALVLGLIFGVMRVSSRSPDLPVNAGWRLLIGLGLVALIWLAVPNWRGLSWMLPVFLFIQAIMFLLPVMPYTLSTLYVEIVRGVPMLVIILYMGFAVAPALRNASQDWPTGVINMQGLPVAIAALAIGYGAYLAEIYRAGIESIPKGQMEAARSLGMSYFQAMRHVILPQAIRVVLPPLGNDFIAMLKDSALISAIALPEVLQQGRFWISRNFRAFEGFNSVAMLYLVMTLLLSLLVRFIEQRSALPGRDE
jgi:ABC-type amino acid transport system permease subunit